MCEWLSYLKPRKTYKLYLLPQYLHYIHILHIKMFRMMSSLMKYRSNNLHTFQVIKLLKVPIHIHCYQLNKVSSQAGNEVLIP